MNLNCKWFLCAISGATVVALAASSLADEGDECDCSNSTYYKAIDLGPLNLTPSVASEGSFGINNKGQQFFTPTSTATFTALCISRARITASARVCTIFTPFSAASLPTPSRVISMKAA